MALGVDMLLLLLITRPLPRDGGMAEDHGAPEAGQLPRVDIARIIWFLLIRL